MCIRDSKDTIIAVEGSKFATTEKSATKSVACEDNVGGFFDSTGIVHHEFAPREQTLNQEYYKSVLQRLRENLRKKRPALWRDKNWVLHNNNAPAHRCLLYTSRCV